MSERIYGHDELMSALIALIIRDGGQVEVSFEEFGEAAVTQQLGEVAIAIERTAKGTAFSLVPSETAERKAGQV